MTTEMDVDLTFDHSEEKELLPEEKREDKRDFEGSQLRVRSDAIDSVVDEYLYQFNINVSIAITEEETDEVQNELTYSISKSFPCMHCEKVYFLRRPNSTCIAKKYASQKEVLRGT